MKVVVVYVFLVLLVLGVTGRQAGSFSPVSLVKSVSKSQTKRDENASVSTRRQQDRALSGKESDMTRQPSSWHYPGRAIAICVAAYAFLSAAVGTDAAKRSSAREKLLQEMEEEEDETKIPVPQISLPKTFPRFPLGGEEVWFRLRARRRQRRGSKQFQEKAEARKAKKEASAKAGGAQLFRGARFWGKAAVIYLSYKKTQLYCALTLLVTPDEEKEQFRRTTWEETHDTNSDRLLDLCLDLRGFYLKTGQFLGTRADFVPKIYLRKLGRLHDNVPAMSSEKVKKIVEEELKGPIENTFQNLNLTHPLGSASISQVHEGILIEGSERVAVKVQYPGAEKVMMSDLGNLKALAAFLQKFELDFDLLSSLRELSRQIKDEFDFTKEASTMDRMQKSLDRTSIEGSHIAVPHSVLSTKKLLVMTFIEGKSLASIRRGEKERFRSLRRRIGTRLLRTLADAWGHMIFTEGLFNADPHPGNIVIMPEGRCWGPSGLILGLLGVKTPRLRVGLLDWGQIKELDIGDRQRLARIIEAISKKKSRDEITSAFKSLGIKLENPDDNDSIEKLALVMFDTRVIPGLDFNPFSDGNVLKLNAVREYPQDLYFVLRVVLMFRGMAESLKVDFSIADIWQPYASKLLTKQPNIPIREETVEEKKKWFSWFG